MFTSRAEFRLSLRADNADARLTPLAIELGIASDERRTKFMAVSQQLDTARDLASSLTMTPSDARRHGIPVNLDGARRSAYELLSRSEMSVSRLTTVWPELASVDANTAESLETEARYAVYLDRQSADVAQVRREEQRAIPEELGFDALPGLSNELKQKIASRRPRTVADAQRIDGMTPAAMAIIVTHARTYEADAGGRVVA